MRTKIRLGACALLVGFTLMMGLPAEPTWSKEKPPAIVAGAATWKGEALAGAQVRIRQGGRCILLAHTDAEGAFHVPLSVKGTVDVQVCRRIDFEPDAGGRPRSRYAVTALATDVALGTLDLRLDATKSTLGRILDRRVLVETPEGVLEHAFVHVWPFPLLPGREEARWTDEKGRATLVFRVTGAEEGDAEIHLDRSPPWCPMRRREDADAEGVCTFHTERSRLLKGKVLDEKGKPLPAIGVLPTGTSESGAVAWGDLTGLDGAFEVGVPERWTHTTLHVGAPAPFAASPAAVTVSVDLAGDRAREPIEIRMRAPPPAGPKLDAASRAVIEAALRHGVLEDGARRIVLVGTDADLFGLLGGCCGFGRSLEGLGEDTKHSYEARNAHGVAAPRNLGLGLPSILLAEDWLHAMHLAQGRTFWHHFYERFPGKSGVVQISAVGFSEDEKQALVTVAHARGDLAGTGVQYLLEKRKDGWIVTATNLLWVS